MNSFIKIPKHFNESLQPILDSKGRVSESFPKNVNELLNFSSKSGFYFISVSFPIYSPTPDAQIFQLVKFYGMEKPDPESKFPNVNWFLRQIGVTYQYVYYRPFRPFPL